MIMRLCHRMINIALTMTFSLISLTLEMKISIPSPSRLQQQSMLFHFTSSLTTVVTDQV